ncbi:cystatin-like protein [Sinobacterium caligoides]|uniref:Cystatin-like protein n=1 Tax=Sinobacterium caligoides TaxID=933926 RepID=A0A3N2E077_9GAMM|nr:cystatin domain-containing protein [Sinobacterium caligoides]ROS05488.1 cystatin-like protein [Sinobacterium caligoides]
MLRNKIALSTCCLLALAACSSQSPATSQPTSPAKDLPSCEAMKGMMGGWRDSKVTPTAQAALDSVLSQMNTTLKLKKITKVRSQVVAGMNYAIEFEFDNGEVWHTTVYHSLADEFTMTQAAAPGPLPAICR